MLGSWKMNSFWETPLIGRGGMLWNRAKTNPTVHRSTLGWHFVESSSTPQVTKLVANHGTWRSFLCWAKDKALWPPGGWVESSPREPPGKLTAGTHQKNWWFGSMFLLLPLGCIFRFHVIFLLGGYLHKLRLFLDTFPFQGNCPISPLRSPALSSPSLFRLVGGVSFLGGYGGFLKCGYPKMDGL